MSFYAFLFFFCFRTWSGEEMSEYKTDIDIAREVTGEHINVIGAKLNIRKEDLVPFGHDKAKIAWNAIDTAQKKQRR